ncbi:MAG: Holliday junction resolvase RuvX [Candidatus Dormibacteria bacterium]
MTPEDSGVRVVGVDIGTRRVGLAAADPTRTIASPLLMIERNHPQFWARLATAVGERRCGLLVVGLPLDQSGEDGPAAEGARTFAAEAALRLGVVVELSDERFTTRQAERSLISQGMRRARRRQVIDSVAAALMLQGWLDAQRSARSA